MQLKGRIRRKVFIEDLKLHLRCGVYPEERKLGVEIKLSVEVCSREFVDYQELYRVISEVSNKTYTYLEDFQDELLRVIVEKWDPDFVRIETIKLSVPFQNSFKGVGVELLWERRT